MEQNRKVEHKRGKNDKSKLETKNRGNGDFLINSRKTNVV